jgi:AP-3 complex subunit delta
LAEPQKLIPELLQPEISNLEPETIAVYIQAATKVFGYWAVEVAQRWEDDDLQEVKEVVDLIMTHISHFVSSPHVEVQERVRLLLSPPATPEHI